jgi:N-acetylneuraminate synthase
MSPLDAKILIGSRHVGAPGSPVFIVAELSANHNQSFTRAVELVRAAKAAGADAIKLQTYTPDTLTIACSNDYFRIRGTQWNGLTLHDLYAKAHTPWEWHAPLKALAQELGLEFFSSPFDSTAVDFLDELGVAAYKIASFEIVDIPLLRYVAGKGKPVIVSTGMAEVAEIEEALTALRDSGARKIALLKCTSGYPAAPDEMNLRTIPHMVATFGVPVGVSDHSLGTAVAIAAVSLGACIVEKHLTLSRADGGPDSAFSLEPNEFEALVGAVRTAERALGTVRYGVSPAEEASRVFRRSLFVVDDVRAGEAFSAVNVRSIRPGHGLHPRHLPEVLTRRASQNISRGTPLAWALIE